MKTDLGILYFVLNSLNPSPLFPRVHVFHIISKSQGIPLCSCKHHHLKLKLLHIGQIRIERQGR